MVAKCVACWQASRMFAHAREQGGSETKAWAWLLAADRAKASKIAVEVSERKFARKNLEPRKSARIRVHDR